jgi:beta-glucosidase
LGNFPKKWYNVGVKTDTAISEKLETDNKIVLPAHFLLGAATSAHQVEGDNINSDWWYWEKKGKVPESGIATDHYHRYEEDFKIAKDIGLNAFRISIEWARIEPAEGQFETKEVEHYLKVLKKMKELGLTRMVTLWHFTLPMWVAEKGGFESREVVEAFARYAWFVAKNLGEEIDLWCTLNEPELYAGIAYGKGTWPPFKKNILLSFNVIRNLISAHKKAYRAIKEVLPQAQIGIAKNSVYYEPFRKYNIFDRVVVWVSNKFGNHYFLSRVRNEMDYIGINYYFYNSMMFSGPTIFVK